MTASTSVITYEIVHKAENAYYGHSEDMRAALEAVADEIRAQPREIDEKALEDAAKAFATTMGCHDIFDGCLKINDEPCVCRTRARAAILAYERARGK